MVATDREALTRIISEAENTTDDEGAWALPEDVADAILAAGFTRHPQPHVVETVEQLSQFYPGDVFKDADGNVWVIDGSYDAFYCAKDGDGDLYPDSEVPLPLTVLTPATQPTHGNGDGTPRPRVNGECPACGSRGLFVGSGGYLTCSWAECPDPGAPHDALTRQPQPHIVETVEELRALPGETLLLLADNTAGRAFHISAWWPGEYVLLPGLLPATVLTPATQPVSDPYEFTAAEVEYVVAAIKENPPYHCVDCMYDDEDSFDRDAVEAALRAARGVSND